MNHIMIDYMKIVYISKILKENVKKTRFFDGKVFLSFEKWTKINVQKWEFQNSTCEKTIL